MYVVQDAVSSLCCKACSRGGLQDKDFMFLQNVPTFMLFKNLELVDQFATRDRKRIAEAIARHADKDDVHVNDISTLHTI